MMAGNRVVTQAAVYVALGVTVFGGSWLVESREPASVSPENAEPATKIERVRRAADLPNLTLIKEELIAYHDCHCDCGCYTDDIEQTGRQALAYLRRYADAHPREGTALPQGLRPALVLDIDETALSNWENIRRTDFGFSHDEYLRWEKEARATAIRPVLDLFQLAKERGIATFFITGRSEAERDWTTKDLESAGYKGWTRLIMRQPDSPKLASEFKSAVRKKLKAEGYTIVENIGDQASDLAGEPSLRNFKLPNPFYLVR